ncbi:MAG: hypothetical protein KKA42_03555, partial [candidate division Zixibacteria bacterium]|nr:hypothetical protein [candidate division Zixibacteria bacterium]
AILGYMCAIVAAAQARGYVVLRYLKDNYNIAAESSLFFTEQPVNDTVENDPGPHTAASGS